MNKLIIFCTFFIIESSCVKVSGSFSEDFYFYRYIVISKFDYFNQVFNIQLLCIHTTG